MLNFFFLLRPSWVSECEETRGCVTARVENSEVAVEQSSTHDRDTDWRADEQSSTRMTGVAKPAAWSRADVRSNRRISSTRV